MIKCNLYHFKKSQCEKKRQKVGTNNMSKINTVLFDFDGTVMDTNDVVYKSWQHTYNTLTGKDGNADYIYKTFGEPLATSMEKAFPNVPVDESIEIYRSFHYEKFEDLIRIFPGIKETLEEVKKRGFKTGLVTSRLKKTTFRGMKKYNLEEYFDDVVTMEDCTKHKPDPEPINIALKKLGSTAAESIMIGDTLFDLFCAKNAGVEYVMVGWAKAVDAKALEGDAKPDYVINKAQELLQII